MRNNFSLAFEICLVSNHLGILHEFGTGNMLQEGYLSKSPLLAEAHLLQQGRFEATGLSDDNVCRLPFCLHGDHWTLLLRCTRSLKAGPCLLCAYARQGVFACRSCVRAID